jgi:hypothetical protein
VAAQAERRAAARNLDAGTLQPLPSSTSSACPSPPSGSRFSVLATASIDHLGQVASDCGVVFHGERGTRVE